MQDATAGFQHPHTAGYSLQEAAVLLGIGVNTLRRRIAAGQIQAEQIERPQGHVWRVYLNVESASQHPPMQEAEQDAIGGSHAIPSEPAPASAIVQAEAISGLVQATVATVLGPLVAELGASRQTIERQAERLEAQAETIGALRTENDALKAAQAQQEARTEAEPVPTSSGVTHTVVAPPLAAGGRPARAGGRGARAAVDVAEVRPSVSWAA